MALVWELILYQAGFFELFKGKGCFLKNCYKSCLLHLNHLKLDATRLWTLIEILILVTLSEYWCQHHFWWRHHSTTNFLPLKFFLCLKSTVFFLKSNDLNLYCMYYYILLTTSAMFKTQGKPWITSIFIFNFFFHWFFFRTQP